MTGKYVLGSTMGIEKQYKKEVRRTTRTYDRIMEDLVPAWAERFRVKSLDYSSSDFEPHRLLGKKGQFADIWRKIWKLKKSMWDGEALTGEGEEEILEDLIAHCFLALDEIRQKKEVAAYVKGSEAD